MAETALDKSARIGMVGLGIMGASIAQRLRDEGYALTVWNLEPERFDLVRDCGAEWADSPAEVWASSDVVFTCVLGDDALESVCFGERGFTRASGGAGLLIDLSTTSPGATLDFAARLKRELGAEWIDAPMSGGPGPARNGEVTLMVGADPGVFSRAAPLLSSVGGNVTLMGPVGAGQKTKILNQQIVGVNYILMAELLATARASDIDPDKLVECLGGGLADSMILQRIFTQMAANDFDNPRSYARQVNKDLKSVSKFVEGLGLDLPLTQLSVQLYRSYAEAGNEMQDGASVSRLYQRK